MFCLHRSIALLSVALGLLFAAASAEARPSAGGKKPPVEGFWDTPAGRVQVVRSGTEVRGTLVSPANGVRLTAGDKVLRGIFEDDNLSAEVRLELVSPACHDDPTHAFVVMLLTRSGKLTGGVSTKSACAASVSALVFRRSADQSPGSDVKAASLAPVAGAGQYDARGRRSTALGASVKPLMEDAAQYLNEGQFEKARAEFEKAVEQDGTVGEAYNGVGVTYAMRNDYENAISWYKRGLEAAPGFGDLYYNLACAYAQLGKTSIALRYFKLAVNKGYTEVATIDADHDLDPIRKDPEFVQLRKGLDGPGRGTSDTSP